MTLDTAAASIYGDVVGWDINGDPLGLGIQACSGLGYTDSNGVFQASLAIPMSGSAGSFELYGTPEPATYTLFGGGLLAAALLRRRKQR